MIIPLQSKNALSLILIASNKEPSIAKASRKDRKGN